MTNAVASNPKTLGLGKVIAFKLDWNQRKEKSGLPVSENSPDYAISKAVSLQKRSELHRLFTEVTQTMNQEIALRISPSSSWVVSLEHHDAACPGELPYERIASWDQPLCEWLPLLQGPLLCRFGWISSRSGSLPCMHQTAPGSPKWQEAKQFMLTCRLNHSSGKISFISP